MESIIEKARELGILIKEDDRTKNMKATETEMNADADLQEKLVKFNSMRDQMFAFMDAKEQDREKVDQLNVEIKTLYDEVMGNPKMQAFNEAKQDFEMLLNEVNNTISFQVTGEIPGGGCSADGCASCGGGCGI